MTEARSENRTAKDVKGGLVGDKETAASERAAREGEAVAVEDLTIDEPVPSLPDRWEVGQTEVEADANATIAEEREAKIKAENERKTREAEEARSGTLSEEERKAKADEATAQAQKQPGEDAETYRQRREREQREELAPDEPVPTSRKR